MYSTNTPTPFRYNYAKKKGTGTPGTFSADNLVNEAQLPSGGRFATNQDKVEFTRKGGVIKFLLNGVEMHTFVGDGDPFNGDMGIGLDLGFGGMAGSSFCTWTNALGCT